VKSVHTYTIEPIFYTWLLFFLPIYDQTIILYNAVVVYKVVCIMSKDYILLFLLHSTNLLSFFPHHLSSSYITELRFFFCCLFCILTHTHHYNWFGPMLIRFSSITIRNRRKKRDRIWSAEYKRKAPSLSSTTSIVITNRHRS
jgi:hypothetical protein